MGCDLVVCSGCAGPTGAASPRGVWGVQPRGVFTLVDELADEGALGGVEGDALDGLFPKDLTRGRVVIRPLASLPVTLLVASMRIAALTGTDNFQHWPPWRPLVVETARRVLDYTGGTLVMPMIVLVEQYWREISTGLTQQPFRYGTSSSTLTKTPSAGASRGTLFLAPPHSVSNTLSPTPRRLARGYTARPRSSTPRTSRPPGRPADRGGRQELRSTRHAKQAQVATKNGLPVPSSANRLNQGPQLSPAPRCQLPREVAPAGVVFGAGSRAGRSGRAELSAQGRQPGTVFRFGHALTQGQERKELHRAASCGRSLQFCGGRRGGSASGPSAGSGRPAGRRRVRIRPALRPPQPSGPFLGP